MAAGTTRKKKRDLRSTFVAGAMVAAAGAIAWFGSGVANRPAGHPSELPAVMAADNSLPPGAPTEVGPLAGALPTRLVIAKAGVDSGIEEVGVVQEQGKWVWQTSWHAAGHHMDSARPGQPGNMVITGHVSVADQRNLAVFKSLDRLAAGDVVDVYSGSEVYHYRVDRVDVVSPTSVKILRSDHRALITMITCTRDLKNRLVVTGSLI